MSRTLILGSRRLDLDTGEVFGRGQLRPTELALIDYLAQRPGEFVSVETLHAAVWGYSPLAQTRAAYTAASRARKLIEEDPGQPKYLVSERGEGYRLVLDAAHASQVGAASQQLQLTGGPLFGRDDDLQWIHSEPWQILTLTGPVGIGKSALAQAAARQASPRGGVWWVDLADAQTPAALVAQVAAMLPTRPASTVEACARALDDLDDAWVVLDGVSGPAIEVCAALLGQWSVRGPGVRVLVTGLGRVQAPAEQARRLRPLPAAAASALVRRQLHLAGAEPDWLTADDLARVVEVGAGVPRALEILSAQVATLGADAALRAATRAGVSASALDALVATSVVLLSPRELAALCDLAAVPGAISAPVVEWVVGTEGALDTVTGLVDRHLVSSVVHSDRTVRFEVSNLVRRYLRRHHPTDPAEPIGRVLAHLAETYRSTEPPLGELSLARGRARYGVEAPAVRLAFTHLQRAVGPGLDHRDMRMGCARAFAGVGHRAAACEVLADPDDDLQALELAWWQLMEGEQVGVDVLYRLVELDPPRPCSVVAADRLRRLREDPQPLLTRVEEWVAQDGSIAALAAVALQRHRITDLRTSSEAHYAEVARLAGAYVRAGDPQSAELCELEVMGLALDFEHLDRAERAAKRLHEVLRRTPHVRDSTTHSTLFVYEAHVHRLRGRHRESVQASRLAIRSVNATGDLPALDRALQVGAMCALQAGDEGLALRWFEALFALPTPTATGRGLHDAFRMPWPTLTEGHEVATAWGAQVRQEALRLGQVSLADFLGFNHAAMMFASGRFEACAAWIDGFVAVPVDPAIERVTRTVWAEALLRCGELERVTAMADEAIERGDDPFWVAHAHALRATVCALRSDAAQAREHLTHTRFVVDGQHQWLRLHEAWVGHLLDGVPPRLEPLPGRIPLALVAAVCEADGTAPQWLRELMA